MWEYKVENVVSIEKRYVNPHDCVYDHNGNAIEEVVYNFNIDKMNELGEQGWEFCKVLGEHKCNDAPNPYFEILFKRKTNKLSEYF